MRIYQSAIGRLSRLAVAGTAFMAITIALAEIATGEPPTKLKSCRRDGAGQTLVEFQSQTLRRLYDARNDVNELAKIGGTSFRLYRSIDGGKTWKLSCPGSFGIFNHALIADYGYAKAPDIGILPDQGASTKNNYRPASFRIAQVFKDKDGKETEVFSEILPPSDKTKMIVNVSAGRRSESRVQDNTVYLDPNNKNRYELDQSGFGVSAGMSLEDQDHVFPGCHFKVEWNGRTWHCWGRQDGMGSVALPIVFGEHPLAIVAEGAYGGRCSASRTIVYNPPGADELKAEAARPVEEYDKVKSYKAEFEKIPARLSALQDELAQQQSSAQQRNLRYEIVKLQAIPVSLEEARLDATLARAKACMMAREWNQALEMANIYFKERPDWIKKYLGHLDGDREASVATQAPDEKEGHDNYLRKFKENMTKNLEIGFMLDLETLMQIAANAGDYTSYLAFAQKRETLLKSIKDDESGSRNQDLLKLYGNMALVTLNLTGDLTQADAYWRQSGSKSPMPWAPPKPPSEISKSPEP